jgi:hypothetical protein
VKDRPVVSAVFRELHEVADVIRGEIGPQIDDERPGAGVNDCLLVAHLLQAERRLEKRGWLGGLGLQEERQDENGGHAETIPTTATPRNLIVSAKSRRLRNHSSSEDQKKRRPGSPRACEIHTRSGDHEASPEFLKLFIS